MKDAGKPSGLLRLFFGLLFAWAFLSIIPEPIKIFAGARIDFDAIEDQDLVDGAACEHQAGEGMPQRAAP